MSPATLENFLVLLQTHPRSTMEQVGLNIMSVRLAAGKSLADLAGQTGILVTHLDLIERGIERPSGTEFVAVAEALEVTFDKFFLGL